jgi:hypothetical protein
MSIFINQNSLSRENIEDAFRKLQTYIYFENTDLHLRNQLAEYIESDGIKRLEKLTQKIRKGPNAFEKQFNSISFHFYPKGVTGKSITENTETLPPNFITNKIYSSSLDVKRLAIFCDLDIELHLISILWILEFGYILDKGLSRFCFGNRLLLNKGKIPPGKTLFKPYQKQYQKWWDNAIKEADTLLNKKENSCIVNFDLKDYFHRANIEFDEIERLIKLKTGKSIEKNHLHRIFKTLHSEYKIRLQKILPNNIKLGKGYPLPVSLLSSFVLGNWHLKKFDAEVIKKIRPVYYGRYVDDIIIVLRDTVIKKFGSEQRKFLESYFVRKNIGYTDKDLNVTNYYLIKYFYSIIKVSNDSEIFYHLNSQGLNNLVLQPEKTFIYQFDYRFSQGLLSKFVDDQKKRSSEFRFLSDSEDSNFDDFEEIVFEDTFEIEDSSKAKFKNIEENKFKISVYLSKLIRRVIERGVDYKENEVLKVNKYFQSVNLIKHYYFWEKLFTLYLVSNRKDFFFNLFQKASDLINSVNLTNHATRLADELKQDLNNHLKYSFEMALSFNPKFITVEDSFEPQNKEIPKYSGVFRKTGLIRKNYTKYPLLHLTSKGKNGVFSLLDKNLVFSPFWTSEDFEIENIRFLPYRIKFYEAYLHNFRKTIVLRSEDVNSNFKRFNLDFTNSNSLLDDSFDLFYNANIHFTNEHQNQRTKNKIKNEYYRNSSSSEIKSNLGKNNLFVNEIYIKNGGSKKNKIRLGIINKYVALENFESSLNGKPNLSKERLEVFDQVLDEASKINNLDIFINPELSLPHSLIYNFCRFSSNKQIGFVSGIEHLKIYNLGFNFIITCLPINIDGEKDTIPIIRLKNHYAPEEEEWIRGKDMVVPKPKPYRYDLLEWKGLYFSSYYCYELADIFHRSAVYSLIDLMIAPVWNQDTHYYNSIIDCSVRDLHCYFAQVNTSQYGETKVSRPTGHVRKNKVQVTGGTIPEYPFTVLVTDVDIQSIRDFQRHGFSEQKERNKANKSFKPTPPDFPIENVLKRINNERFFE